MLLKLPAIKLWVRLSAISQFSEENQADELVSAIFVSIFTKHFYLKLFQIFSVCFSATCILIAAGYIHVVLLLEIHLAFSGAVHEVWTSFKRT